MSSFYNFILISDILNMILNNIFVFFCYENFFYFFINKSIKHDRLKYVNNYNNDNDNIVYACFFFAPFDFLTTPPRITQRFALNISFTSGDILQTCFLGALKSNSLNEVKSCAVFGNCFNAGHLRHDNSCNCL